MATSATIKKIETTDGLTLTAEAKELLPVLYKQLADLPDWGSARDVYRLILPMMYSKRSSRLGQLARIRKQEQVKEAAGGATAARPEEAPPVSRRQRAERSMKPQVIEPYEAADVRHAFADALASRGAGGDDDNDTSISGTPGAQSTAGSSNGLKKTRVMQIGNMAACNREIDKAKIAGDLLVIDFSASWCPPSREMKPKFDSLSRQNTKIKFGIVDSDKAPDVFKKFGVESMPTIKFFLDGEVVATVRGFNEAEVRKNLNDLGRLAERKKINALPPPANAPNDVRGGDGGGGGGVGRPVLKEKRRENINQNINAPGGGPADRDLMAALEEACGELGYSLEDIEAFLTSGAYPEELVNLLMTKTGITDKAELVEKLRPQKGPFLEKIKAAIVEKKRKKSEEEIAKQQKLKKIGKCPMNFDWIKHPGGYRCAGGSHWVSDAQMNFLE